MGKNELLNKLNKIHELKNEEIEKAFTKVAEEIFNKHILVVKNKEKKINYRITEIEFYFNDECSNNNHPDPYTHRHYRQRLNAQWYFHRSGRGGLDITFGKGRSYGGILLRSMEYIENNQIIKGPVNTRNEILAEVRITQKNKDMISKIEEKCIFNSDNLLQLAKNNSSNKIKLELYTAPRTGLRPNKDKPEWENFIMKNYRYFTKPSNQNNNLSDGRELIILSLLKNSNNQREESIVRENFYENIESQTIINYKKYYEDGKKLRKKDKKDEKEKFLKVLINEINTNFGVYKKCKLYGLLNEGEKNEKHR